MADHLTLAAFTAAAHIWSAGYGDTLSQYLGSVALHPDGGVASVGSFTGSIDFGGGPMTTATDAVDMFLVRLDAGGQYVWSRRFALNPPFFSPWAHALAVDGDGNAIVAGEFRGAINFGGATLTATGSRSAFVAKFDGAGGHVWSRKFGTSVMASALAVDGIGNIAVAGNATGVIDLGGGALSSQGGEDVFVAVLGPDGTHRWSRRIGPLNNQIVGAVAMDSAGRLALAGEFTGSIDPGAGAFASAGVTDAFVAVYDATGAHLWSRGIGDAHADRATDVAIDSIAGVVVTGAFRGTVDLGGGPLSVREPASDGFVGAYSISGTPLWGTQLGDTESAVVATVATDETGNVVIAGSFRSGITLGAMTLIGPDGFLAVLDATGSAASLMRLRSDGTGSDLDAAAPGRIAFGATNGAYMNLGGDAIVSAGRSDVLLAELSLQAEVFPIVSFGAVVAGGSIEVRWLVRDELATEFTLERQGTDGDARAVVASGAIHSPNGVYADPNVTPRGEYTYQLTVRSDNGEEFQSWDATVRVPPLATALSQNAPNPFPLSTEIEYRLEHAAVVAIGIYDVTGARVRVLAEGARGAGVQRATWDARDDAGRPVASGVYFYRLEGAPGTAPRKMLLVR